MIRRILILLLLAILAFSIFLLAEDFTYDEIQTDMLTDENRRALVVTWETDDQMAFWRDYEKSIHPTVKDLHDQKLIKQVFPFHHKAFNYEEEDQQWTNCIVLMLSDKVDHSLYSSLDSVIRKSAVAGNFRALDVMKVQKGIDMFYPVKNGISREPKMSQTIEYLFSNMEARKSYYEDQYRFSGPAMQDLHSRDKVGRFVGFELEKRIAATENMPEWDLIHIIGFTTWQEIKAAPFFYSTWNKHAERAFGEGMTMKKKVAEWDQIRINVKGKILQNFALTLR
ncbi:hypothetical protein FNH22_19645 [Fulvivirga sp. M361]|uniref:hypothetical protein n=1 Tax=Fulvivirga sp. M361 TaxID=2594266 RepID=UPI00117A96FF|nr:hypothetical protein [Fulvivirga sp. M361]TRX54331.1 hypothetical protein FNH22_19645 [Fulvivirga sp. M361]